MVWLKSRRDNLGVDGELVVSQGSVHGTASLAGVHDLINVSLSLCQFDFQVRSLLLPMDTECPVARQRSPTPVGLSRFECSL